MPSDQLKTSLSPPSIPGSSRIAVLGVRRRHQYEGGRPLRVRERQSLLLLFRCLSLGI